MMYKQYSVSMRGKKPLLDYILSSLSKCGCTVLRHSSPDAAPFRITFEAPDGERMGIIAYAFLANSKRTRNRPEDEHRFQVKYGGDDKQLHEIWQDPFELYTTLFLGIHLERGVFIGADPTLHSPTRFFISVEFKELNVIEILQKGWATWERERRSRSGLDDPIEILVGGLPENFLSYVRFERAAKGLDQGHRALLADKMQELTSFSRSLPVGAVALTPQPHLVHTLAEEFELSRDEILDLIQSAPRLKMAVRGWVAEMHLERYLRTFPDITECRRIEEDGKPDLMLRYQESQSLTIECKNVLRKVYSDGLPRVDFQKTRASKADPCSRYYKPDEFDIVAACLHPRTERWEFSFVLTRALDLHPKCVGRLSNSVRLDARWSPSPLPVLVAALK
jgi:hypothetical protein